VGVFSYSIVPGMVSFSCQSQHESESFKSEILTRIPESQYQMNTGFDIEIPMQEFEIIISNGWRPRPLHQIENQLLSDLKLRRRERNSLFNETQEITTSKITTSLEEMNLGRKPTDFQKRNLSRLLRYRSGATFSVPGAGKTSEAICYWLYHRKENERLLIALPKVASMSWKHELNQWLGWGDNEILTLNKPATHMRRFLFENSEKTVYLVNYHKLRGAVSQIANFMATTSSDGWSMILDESHYIKNNSGATSLAARQLSGFVDGCRLIMTGTPAPQGPEDLRSQAEFLQGLPLSEEQSRDLIERIYVRTSKDDLELLIPDCESIVQPHKPIHQLAYDELFENVIDEISPISNNPNLRSIRPHMMTLRRAATDPDSVPGLSNHLVSEELPWKFEYVFERIRAASEEGRKIIVWSTFVSNLEKLENLLLEFDPAIVYGAISSDPNASLRGRAKIGSREWMFDKFKFDDSCSVLLANPAACGESISLHHWCNEAIYLDRSYNAAHFLQSKDRIHRYGQHPKTGEHTCKVNQVQYKILITEGTIDGRINDRLDQKIRDQNILLESGQFHLALEEEGTSDSIQGEEGGGSSNQDVLDFINSFR
jgi:SNF2 family DNA or RNA helicase